MRLADKVALITDIGSETGAAVARRFVAEGATVFGCRGAGVRAGAAKAPDDVTVLDGDPRVPTEAAAMVNAIDQKSGRLDVLVDHGVGGRLVGTVLDVSEGDFREAMAGDVWSVIALSSAAIPLMRRGGGGSIVNIASIGWQGLKGRPLRASSQAAVVALTRSMAADHAEDSIRVNALLLGPTWTSNYSPAQVEELARKSPLGRLATPEDVAAGALFLASDDAALVTGALLPLDAGRSLPTA